MKCPKCNSENNDDSKFCKKCGEPLNVKTQNKQKLIIVALIIVVAILAIGVLYGTGIIKGEVPLETHDFGAFKMDVPVGSDFVISEEGKALNDEYIVWYVNNGEHSEDFNGIFISKNLDKKATEKTGELIETQGNMEIYKNVTEGVTIYAIYLTEDNCQLLIFGDNLDVLKKVAPTFKEVDLDKLSSNYAPKTTSTQSSPSSSSTPSSIKILGGSFSTGSGDADKTYARINVGTQHAGENVIVQIYYSRDGNTLNNGNMVPATVHSDGYLEISSADAYKYYPDHATIKIYDSNSKLLTTTDVNLSPTSGTQTF